MIRGLEHLAHEDRLKEFKLFRMKRTQLFRNLIASFQYLKGAYKKERDIFKFLVIGQEGMVLNYKRSAIC